MAFSHLFKQARINHVNHHIDMEARGAAESIIGRIDKGEQPPYRFNASTPPKPLTREEFSRLTGQAAVRWIESQMVSPVDYDHDASQSATDEIPAIQPGQKPPKGPDDVILVFSPTTPPLS